MVNALADVYLTINNLATMYSPNSLSFNDGRGERVVRTQTIGGGMSEIVVSDNIETHYGKVKFQMRNDLENIEKALAWRDNGSGNVVVLTNRTGTFNLTFKQAIIVNNPDYELSSEGNFEIEFHSSIPV